MLHRTSVLPPMPGQHETARRSGTAVATSDGMQITDRQRWLLVAGLASFAAGQIATRMSAETWRLAAGNDPPEDPTDRDFDWTPALMFGAAAGAATGIAVILARGGTGKVWKEATGRKPPRSRKRSKRN